MIDRDREYVEFVETVGASLRRTAFLICGDWHRANDVVQDAFYKLYLAWGRVERSRNPAAYARRVVVNQALDLRRRPWRREVPTDTLPDRADGDLAADHAVRDEMFAALATLPPRQRACVVLRYYEDLSTEQTAELLGCSDGTVRSQSARGLATLRHVMNGSQVVTGDSR